MLELKVLKKQKKRIKNRVEKGGHNIADEIVEKRYYESLENLKQVILKFDEIYFYDNSEKYKNIFSVMDNKIFYKDKNFNWSKEAIEVIENREKI